MILWVDIDQTLFELGADLGHDGAWTLTLEQWASILKLRKQLNAYQLRPLFRQLDTPSTSLMMNWNRVQWGHQQLRIERGS